MTALSVEGLSIAFGGIKAVDDLSFDIEPGRIFSIIGPNGAGKTTLFNIISGLYRPTGGRVHLHGEDVTGLAPHRLAAKGLSRTFQNLQIFFRMTALENVMVGCHPQERGRILPHLLSLPAVRRQNRETAARARTLLAEVGLADVAALPASSLSYGALKRLEIARALAANPRLLLLDEPAAGCNATETAEIDALIQAIAARGTTVALVEHDMKLVMKISHRILVLDYGRKLAEGSAQEVRSNPDVVRAYLGTEAHEGAHHAG